MKDRIRQSVHGTLMVLTAFNGLQSMVSPAYAQQAVNVVNATPLGQATLASSSPVAPASNWINDPCYGTNTKTDVPISTALGSTQVVAGVAAQKIYVCATLGFVSAAINLSFIEGTGSTCASPTADVGSTGAAGGLPIAANGGWAFGSGAGTVIRTTNASASLCLLQSGTALLAGTLSLIQQ